MPPVVLLTGAGASDDTGPWVDLTDPLVWAW